MPTATRSRLLLFTGLYFAQGVPWGFFTIAIMLQLTTKGLGPAALGAISSTAWLPWMGKPILGLLVDRVSFGRFGRCRIHILIAEIGMACSLLGMAFAEPMQGLSLFAALLFLHNLFAALQDVGTDALAIDTLPPDERGRANGFMSAGKFAGVVVGGQGLLWIARIAGWPVAYLAAVALLLVPASLVWLAEESSQSAPPRHLGRDVLRLLSFRIVLVGAVFAMIADGSDSLLFPLVFPLFSGQLHFDEQQIATLSILGGAVTAVASIGGGWLSDRIGRRRSVVLGCLGVAAFDVVFVLARDWWTSYAFQLAFAATSAVATGVVYASLSALFMDLSHPKLAATHFQLSMSLFNVRGIWGGRVGGSLAEQLSPRAMFGLAAVIEVLPLLLLPWLDRNEAKRVFDAEADRTAQSREGSARAASP